MLGNEDVGLPKWLVGAADRKITIGGCSASASMSDLDSLNVSVAAAFFMERFLARPNANATSEGQVEQNREKVGEQEVKEGQLF